MSLSIFEVTSDILLPVAEQPEALLALQTAERARISAPTPYQGHYRQQPNAVLGASTLAEALEAYHLAAELDEQGNLVAFRSGCGNFHGDDEYTTRVFTAIAPSVRAGSWVSLHVEDDGLTHTYFDYLWRFTGHGVALTTDPPHPYQPKPQQHGRRGGVR
jgi:hypothetical protein